MVGAEQVVHLWKEWGIQVLVLLSFTLQVMLLVLAEFRKSIDSSVVRAFSWSAYQLADSVAIYVLGHFSVSSRYPKDQLMAFWAPFLLVHLGGQDNITAYAIEDNQLWLRHLQILAVQVAACAYVLFKSFIVSTWSLLHWATMLMFVVGIIKYGERVWALKRAGSVPTGNNYRSFPRWQGFYGMDHTKVLKNIQGREAFLLIAHQLMDIPKAFLKKTIAVGIRHFPIRLRVEQMYEVVEMQLSLMHDILYTKAEVMNTWYGISIRIISVLGTAVASVLLVLHLGGPKDSYSGVDVAVTYILLAGALVLETTSILRAMFSSWTCSLLLKKNFNRVGNYRKKPWASLCRVVACLRRLVYAAEWRRRYWSGTMGQHNLLQLCVHSKNSRRSKMARWIGLEDPWNTLAYSWFIPVSVGVEQLLLKQVLKSRGVSRESPDHIVNSGGQAALKSNPLYGGLTWSLRHGRAQEVDLQESILIWHIGTNIYLSWYKRQQEDARGQQDDIERRANIVEQQADVQQRANTVEALSNYMLFLLATRPHMLPSPARHKIYMETCYGLAGLSYSSVKDLAAYLQRRHVRPLFMTTEDEQDDAEGSDTRISRGNNEAATEDQQDGVQDSETSISRGNNEAITEDPVEDYDRRTSLGDNETVYRGCKLGVKLINMESAAADTLEVMGQVWAEMLCYAGRRCGVDSHAKQLSSGSELTTVAALLMEHMVEDALSNLNLPAQSSETV